MSCLFVFADVMHNVGGILYKEIIPLLQDFVCAISPKYSPMEQKSSFATEKRCTAFASRSTKELRLVLLPSQYGIHRVILDLK